jgi:transposase
LSDPFCRPIAFHLTGGQVADIKGGEPLALLSQNVPTFLADKAYDCTRLREQLNAQNTTPVIPNKSNRKNPYAFDKEAYKARNVVERMFCRLKDFRRIAMRYDKLSRNFMAALCIAAVTAYWIN